MNGRRRPAGCSDRSVRNGSRSRTGTAPKDPVTTDPSPYPRRACDGRASAVVPAASSAPVVVGMDGAQSASGGDVGLRD